MEYTELTVSTTTAGADAVSDLLMRLGAAGTQIIDRNDLPDPDRPGRNWELMDRALLDAMPEDVQIKAWFSAEEAGRVTDTLRLELERLRAEDADGAFGALTLSSGSIREEDWANEWKRYFKPFRVGRHLVVKPTWERWDAAPDDLIIEIDPGMAFGTGTHETTALCIELIEAYYQQGRLLDIGTGSGILAIAAALLGAKDVYAIDIDEDAVRVARENVEKNGFSKAITVEKGDLLKGVRGTYDFAVANILAPVICMLAAPLRKYLTPNGIFVCSGIIREKRDDVFAALTEAGYEILDERSRGDWCAFAARNPG